MQRRTLTLASSYYIEHENACHSLDNVDTFKDIGVQFDNKLTFEGHIHQKINKAYSVLGIIKRNFILCWQVYIHFVV